MSDPRDPRLRAKHGGGLATWREGLSKGGNSTSKSGRTKTLSRPQATESAYHSPAGARGRPASWARGGALCDSQWPPFFVSQGDAKRSRWQEQWQVTPYFRSGTLNLGSWICSKWRGQACPLIPREVLSTRQVDTSLCGHVRKKSGTKRLLVARAQMAKSRRRWSPEQGPAGGHPLRCHRGHPRAGEVRGHPRWSLQADSSALPGVWASSRGC